MSHHHKAEDGTELPVKEGIVLDREGRPVSGPKVVFTQMPWIWAGALGLIVPFVLVAGLAVMGGLFAVGTLYWAFKTLVGPTHRRN